MPVVLNFRTLAEHRRQNARHSRVLMVGIGSLMLVSASLIWSWYGALVALLTLAGVAVLGPQIKPEAVMRLYRAQPLDPHRAGSLTHVLSLLATRAGLPAPPKLYVVPSLTLNALAAGTPDHAAIAVTEGLLRRLTLRQIAGVLAHEISHIRNHDLWVMGLADAMTRFTQVLAYVAMAMLLINIPAALLGLETFSWLAILILYLSPLASSLLQLALSRSREYDADLNAADLTGDPVGLASALRTVEHDQGSFWGNFMFPFPVRRIPHPSVLRSHPETEVRVRRLLELAEHRHLHSIKIATPLFSMVGVGPASLSPPNRWPGIGS